MKKKCKKNNEESDTRVYNAKRLSPRTRKKHVAKDNAEKKINCKPADIDVKVERTSHVHPEKVFSIRRLPTMIAEDVNRLAKPKPLFSYIELQSENPQHQPTEQDRPMRMQALPPDRIRLQWQPEKDCQESQPLRPEVHLGLKPSLTTRQFSITCFKQVDRESFLKCQAKVHCQSEKADKPQQPDKTSEVPDKVPPESVDQKYSDQQLDQARESKDNTGKSGLSFNLERAQCSDLLEKDYYFIDIQEGCFFQSTMLNGGSLSCGIENDLRFWSREQHILCKNVRHFQMLEVQLLGRQVWDFNCHLANQRLARKNQL